MILIKFFRLFLPLCAARNHCPPPLLVDSQCGWPLPRKRDLRSLKITDNLRVWRKMFHRHYVMGNSKCFQQKLIFSLPFRTLFVRAVVYVIINCSCRYSTYIALVHSIISLFLYFKCKCFISCRCWRATIFYQYLTLYGIASGYHFRGVFWMVCRHSYVHDDVIFRCANFT